MTARRAAATCACARPRLSLARAATGRDDLRPRVPSLGLGRAGSALGLRLPVLRGRASTASTTASCSKICWPATHICAMSAGSAGRSASSAEFGRCSSWCSRADAAGRIAAHPRVGIRRATMMGAGAAMAESAVRAPRRRSRVIGLGARENSMASAGSAPISSVAPVANPIHRNARYVQIDHGRGRTSPKGGKAGQCRGHVAAPCRRAKADGSIEYRMGFEDSIGEDDIRFKSEGIDLVMSPEDVPAARRHHHGLRRDRRPAIRTSSSSIPKTRNYQPPRDD
jgi:hypothetical protein